MVSYILIFSLGIVISLINIFLWSVTLRSQLKQLGNKANSAIKHNLLIFGFTSMLSNIVPIWFDVYQIGQSRHPTNIGFALLTSYYLSNTVSAFMFYLIYKE